ncbi:MAG: DUF5329 family protein [Planctomycetaceae bacterium]
MPVELTVKQRSTVPIPGSGDNLLLTVDDVTRGQIQVTLLEKGRAALFGPISMTPDNSIPFAYGDARYSLHLKTLHNALVGEDFAEFVIRGASAAAAAKLTEDEKIEKLIATIASLDKAVFIRDGAEHTSAEAAGHLRDKWNAKKDEVKTAEDFIKLVATSATLSGEPYRIRSADGTEMASSEFLRKRLAEIESSADVAAVSEKEKPE